MLKGQEMDACCTKEPQITMAMDKLESRILEAKEKSEYLANRLERVMRHPEPMNDSKKEATAISSKAPIAASLDEYTLFAEKTIMVLDDILNRLEV